MKILVSHEVPICLLNDSSTFNDFDYALVHLFETHPEYYHYFYNARHVYGREVLLDNSIFELGKSFDAVKFMEWIIKLEPSCYIVPDVLENSNGTIANFQNWRYMLEGGIQNTPAHTARKIGVVQGKTFSELVRCYQFMSQHADQLAISFDYSYYQITGLGNTHLERNATGRQRLINDLIREGIWNWRKPVHLLGCSLAREFRWYVDNNIYNIRSCDTSNPIIAGMEGKEYDGEFGLNSKSTTKLADEINMQLTQEQLDLVFKNIDHFKTIVSR